ncbi:MAG: CoA transferase [Chloroflexota bacterium]|nr:CoA transferase [Chloroflexota bacterium]
MQALEGVKVLDFSWIVAGPTATKVMGDYGATVIKVEGTTRHDVTRTAYSVWVGGIPGMNRSGLFAWYNSSKYGITLNLNNPSSKEVARRLVDWSDIVVENFTPGTMTRWGLDYNSLKRIKPDVIMISASMEGQTGPRATQPGFGTMLQAGAGFTNFIGWPDRGPVGLSIMYTDFVAPWFMVIAAMVSLEHRRQSGEGQYIDLSQMEASIPFLSSAILNYVANGQIETASGNRSSEYCPHGVYRCCGEDRWCAIAIYSDEEWRAFCSVMGDLPWAIDPRFFTLQNRKENEDELDKLIETWTVGQEAEGVMHRLQAKGVAAGIIENGNDCLEADPQLKHRHHFLEVDHPEMGAHLSESSSFILSKTPINVRRSPCLGEHNEFVCTQILNMSDEEFIKTLAEGAFG